jgi:hypothetical protein
MRRCRIITVRCPLKKGTGSVPAEFRGSAARFSRGASRLFQRTLSTLVCLSLTVLVAAQDESPAPPAPAPRAEVSTQEWNFGVAWQGQPLKQDVVVKNVGTATLEITDVSSTCGCTVPTRPKSPLAPGESSTMSISYDSARRVGKANHTVTLITNDPTQRSIPIKLFGEVKPLYEVEPKEGLTFGQLYQKSSETREVTIVNRYTEPLRLQLKAGQDFGPFDIALQELDAGQRYRLTAPAVEGRSLPGDGSPVHRVRAGPGGQGVALWLCAAARIRPAQQALLAQKLSERDEARAAPHFRTGLPAGAY